MFKSDHFFWLLSTCPQVIAAIVGIILMLSVFKLQQLNDKLMQIMRDSYSGRMAILGKQYIVCTATKFVSLMDPVTIEPGMDDKKKEAIAGLLLFASEAKKIINVKNEILSKLKICLTFNAFVIAMYLLLIPFTDILVPHSVACLFIIIFVLFLSFASIVGYTFVVIGSYLDKGDMNV